MLVANLKTRKSTGTSRKKIHFSIQTTKFLMKYNLFYLKISGNLVIFSAHTYEVPTSFMKGNKRFE